MDNKNPVEIADRLSRKRPIIIAAAAITFVAAQLLATRPHAGQTVLFTFWCILLLLLIATGGGLLHQTKIRALMNDEVSRDHHRTAIAAGFWMAMAAALVFYWLPGVDSHSARQLIQGILTIGIATALLAFAYLEIRAQRA